MVGIIYLRNKLNAFCEATGKQDISQLNVRNINQINLPLPFKSGINEYLNLIPIIPNGINKNLDNFFIQLNTQNNNNTLKGIIAQTIIPQQSNNSFFTILLDIAVIKAGNFVCNEKFMWDSFIELREFKDNLFENCLTTKLKELLIGNN